MVDSAIPVARATCAMPPYPIACASVAAHTRRDRSVRTGDSAACFARRVARSTSARYYSLIRSTRSYFLTGPKQERSTGTTCSRTRWLLDASGHRDQKGHQHRDEVLLPGRKGLLAARDHDHCPASPPGRRRVLEGWCQEVPVRRPRMGRVPWHCH